MSEQDTASGRRWETLRETATKIAEALFVNGAGQRARRLVLTIDGPPKQDIGGWGYEPAIDMIMRVLEGQTRGRRHD
jgi:hypothetical protein